MHVLVIEDNPKIVDVLQRYLRQAGHEPHVVDDGKGALSYFYNHAIDFILLDIMLPNVDGFEICQKIRELSTVPIIMITAKTEDADRILGLEVGADDYIIKPFSPNEVLSRIAAVMRRISFENEGSKNQLILGEIRLDLESRRAFCQHQELQLTKKEFELLALFTRYPQKVFSRDNILDTVWGYDYYGDSRTVDSHIKRLRAKLRAVSITNYQIKTVWGEGYRLEFIQ